MYSSRSPSANNRGTGFRIVRKAFVENPNGPGPNIQRQDDGDTESSTADDRQQKVSISRPFFLSDSEISEGTFRQFSSDQDYAKKFPNECLTDWSGESTYHSPSPDHPVQYVHWVDAVKFCNWLSRKEGFVPCYELTDDKETGKAETATESWKLVAGSNGYRLPTEAHWEMACRAGTTTDFSIGNATAIEKNLTLVKRYAVGNLSRTGKTGSKLPNGWGFFDMHRNVAEWCQDWLGEFADTAAVVDPTGPLRRPEKPRRVIRGGFFSNSPASFRSSRDLEYVLLASDRNPSVGFRIMRPLELDE